MVKWPFSWLSDQERWLSGLLHLETMVFVGQLLFLSLQFSSADGIDQEQKHNTTTRWWFQSFLYVNPYLGEDDPI